MVTNNNIMVSRGKKTLRTTKKRYREPKRGKRYDRDNGDGRFIEILCDGRGLSLSLSWIKGEVCAKILIGAQETNANLERQWETGTYTAVSTPCLPAERPKLLAPTPPRENFSFRFVSPWAQGQGTGAVQLDANVNYVVCTCLSKCKPRIMNEQN